MGRWAQAKKRGSSASGYSNAAPSASDWTLSQPGGAGLSTIATLLIPIPLPSTAWAVLFTVNGTGGGRFTGSSSTLNLGIFAPGTVIAAQAQFVIPGGAPGSEYGPVKFYTTI
jgi:hypothetical protein